MKKYAKIMNFGMLQYLMKKILKYNPYLKPIRVTFLIYADLKFLIKKTLEIKKN